jgi:hypothetical protein
MKEALKMAKGKSKYVSFAAQREQCRLNKYTYTEKCACDIVTLMCNYPFSETTHKKGVCRANTCTDMRKTLATDIDEINSQGEPVKDEEPGAELTKEVDEQIAHEEAETSLDEVAKENAAKEEDPEGAVRAE